MVRNPRYFGRAADGTALPYLDRLVIDVIPDQSAELLRLGEAPGAKISPLSMTGG